MIENFISNLFGGAKKSRSHKKRSHKKRSVHTPKQSPTSLPLGTKRKGRDGKMYQVNFKGRKLAWERCVKRRCSGAGKIQQGPSPQKGGKKSTKRRSKKRSMKRKSSKRKSPKRKSSKRKSPKRKSSKRKSPKRKSSKRKSPKRKSSKRKSPKRKSSKRKSPKGNVRRYLNPATGKYSLKKKASLKVWKMHEKRGTLKTGPSL